MSNIDRYSPFTSVLAHPAAVQILDRVAPEVMQSSVASQLSGFPTGAVLGIILGAEDPRVAQLQEELAAFVDVAPALPEEDPILPSPAYEDAQVSRASATVTLPDRAEVHSMVELSLAGPSHGNPFVEVDVIAVFRSRDDAVRVGGFYDGAGTYRIRFLPPSAGEWSFKTTSNARSLDGVVGTLWVGSSSQPGPVRVSQDDAHFAYADGTPFTPIGTTAYVWTLQDESLQDETLRSLAAAPFNKLRMGLFPKDFLYNSNEPKHVPFASSPSGGWDTTRFDIDYFANLERRLRQLGELGIQADVILFHPYDRWGFSKLPKTVDDRYVSYVVRRLAAFPNVWWSLANEYDLLLTKRAGDWDRLAGRILAEDHVRHPISIHNWVEIFDYSAEWATHASIQRGDYRIGGMVDQWRRKWGKPVIVDEFGYEGDLDQGWGNLTAKEVVRMFWDGTVRGGYLTHGETFYSDDEIVFWSKGGTLRGDSLPRLGFLKQIVAASPSGFVDPLPSDWDAQWGGVPGKYILIYFGGARPLFRNVLIPDGMTAEIDVIDTWKMTIHTLPGRHTGQVKVDLPARPYIAIRLREVVASSS